MRIHDPRWELQAEAPRGVRVCVNDARPARLRVCAPRPELARRLSDRLGGGVYRPLIAGQGPQTAQRVAEPLGIAHPAIAGDRAAADRPRPCEPGRSGRILRRVRRT
jgi:hypothetical protein